MLYLNSFAASTGIEITTGFCLAIRISKPKIHPLQRFCKNWNSVTELTQSAAELGNSVPALINYVPTLIHSATDLINSVAGLINSATEFPNSVTTFQNSVTTLINSVAEFPNSVTELINSEGQFCLLLSRPGTGPVKACGGPGCFTNTLSAAHEDMVPALTSFIFSDL